MPELNNSLILQYIFPYSFSIRNLSFRAIKNNCNDNDDDDDIKNINNTNLKTDNNGNDYGDNSNNKNVYFEIEESHEIECKH